jgi:hypothetical protein
MSDSILNYMVSIAEIIGALATAAAFWVTYLTLKQMKSQAELANNPYLKIRFRNIKDVGAYIQQNPHIPNHLDNEPYETWLSIINKNLNQDLTGLVDYILFLEFSNAGKSEITNIHFDLNLVVSMFENNILGYNIEPTKYKWKKDLQVELTERGVVSIAIVNTKYFPIYQCKITNLIYTDIRGNSFIEFDGPNETDIVENQILIPLNLKSEVEEEISK